MPLMPPLRFPRHCFPALRGALLGVRRLINSMSLIPRWRYMTDEAKALTRRSAISAAVVLLVLLVFRGLLPWVLVALLAWWIWKAFSK